MNRLVILLLEAITDFIVTGGGTLTGYMVANGAVVMPSKAGVLAAVVFGLVGAANQVKARLKDLPVLGAAAVILTFLAGCAGPGFATGMSPAQLHEWAKIKDASATCVKAVYAGATITTVSVSADRGIQSGVVIKDGCEVQLMTDGGGASGKGLKPGP